MATEIQKPKDSELEGELTKKTLDIGSEKPADDESLIKEDEPKSSESLDTALPSSTVDSSSTASDLQKKMRRAERFGMPVQLSEKEKRNSRAERFGTASTTPESDELKKSEDLKRKARAERFGLPAKSVADEEAKKKARQTRFGPDSKKDSVEEDKMKARAIRFSKTPAEARSEINGKDSSVQEPATGNKVNGDT